MKAEQNIGRAYYACAAFTGFSALVSASFSLMALRISGGHEYALYAASRSVALPIALLCAMALRSRGGVASLATAMTLVNDSTLYRVTVCMMRAEHLARLSLRA